MPLPLSCLLLLRKFNFVNSFFKVSNPSGFKTNDRFILILNSDGTIFYSMENKTGGALHFNLPKGLYESSNNLIPSPFRVYNRPTIKARDPLVKLPKNISIIKKPNRNKCSIDTQLNTIYIDPSLYNLPRNVWTFVLIHELGHYWWTRAKHGADAEKYCDDFACAKMLELGFNPSQCYDGADLCLSNFSIDRKINQMENAQNSFERQRRGHGVVNINNNKSFYR